jgi:hypothetical protein
MRRLHNFAALLHVPRKVLPPQRKRRARPDSRALPAKVDTTFAVRKRDQAKTEQLSDSKKSENALGRMIQP